MRRIVPLCLLLALAAPAHAGERRFMLSGFDRVRVDGPFEVTVTSGQSPGAVAVGDTRALDGVSVRLNGTTLVISPGVNAWGGDPRAPRSYAAIRITAAALRGVMVTGSGKVSVDRLSGQRIEIGLTGAGALDVYQVEGDRLSATVLGTGRLRLAGRVLDASFQTSGAPEVEATDLSAGTLTVNAQSAGNASFRARSAARVTALGQGSISVAGNAKCTVSGPGPVKCGAMADAP